jgi:hypothetical protein
MSSPTSQQLARDALDEHQQIHFFLDQIDTALEGLHGELADVEPMRRLAAQIEGLKDRLREHQQLEEQGGLFRVILDSLPEARVEVSRLVRQHERMIDILEMARIHAQCGDVSDAADLRTDLEQFLVMFREHEHAEEKLIKDAIARESDEGESD